jgi:dephospho-CoA kinase
MLGKVDPIVIGLLGRQGSGKSTVARYLRDTFGAQVISFASPLKNMADLYGQAPRFFP